MSTETDAGDRRLTASLAAEVDSEIAALVERLIARAALDLHDGTNEASRLLSTLDADDLRAVADTMSVMLIGHPDGSGPLAAYSIDDDEGRRRLEAQAGV